MRTMLVSLRLDENLVSRIDKIVIKNALSGRTEFIERALLYALDFPPKGGVINYPRKAPRVLRSAADEFPWE